MKRPFGPSEELSDFARAGGRWCFPALAFLVDSSFKFLVSKYDEYDSKRLFQGPLGGLQVLVSHAQLGQQASP